MALAGGYAAPVAKKKDRIDEERLQRKLVEAVLETGIRDGSIDPTGKSEEELEAEFLRYLGRFAAPNSEVAFIDDHTKTLLGEARAYRESGQSELACVLYATWAEHFLNQLVITGAKRKGLSETDGVQMVRDLSYRSKVTWVPKLLGFRAIATSHQKALLKLGELRNQYVHYKWRGYNPDLDEPEEEYANAVADFEKTVGYLGGYERREIYSGQKAAPRRFTKHSGSVERSAKSRGAYFRGRAILASP